MPAASTFSIGIMIEFHAFMWPLGAKDQALRYAANLHTAGAKGLRKICIYSTYYHPTPVQPCDLPHVSQLQWRGESDGNACLCNAMAESTLTSHKNAGTSFYPAFEIGSHGFSHLCNLIPV